MRMLKQFVEFTKTTPTGLISPVEGALVGLFENGDRVQELFMLTFASGKTQSDGTSKPKNSVHVFDPDKQDWIEFKEFQKTGP